MLKLYSYVGPKDIRQAVRGFPAGAILDRPEDLVDWLELQTETLNSDGSFTATFVVDPTGAFRVAPRRSEHVACASGGPVLSAGEVTFHQGEVIEITNQSTGFCPQPDSWPAVAKSLDGIPLARPDSFSREVIFRLCLICQQRNIVKDNWFECGLCGSTLPISWNFS